MTTLDTRPAPLLDTAIIDAAILDTIPGRNRAREVLLVVAKLLLAAVVTVLIGELMTPVA